VATLPTNLPTVTLLCQDNRPIYRKPEHNKINRTNVNSICLNNDIQKKFKHLISNDHSSRIVNLEREKFFQRNTKFHQKENTAASNLNDVSNHYEHELLSKEIEELKKTVRLQSQQIKEIKEENSQLKQQIKEINSNLSNVNKEIISLKESNKSIDKKIDIIINKLDEQQEILQYQYKTQKLGSLQIVLRSG
jgi:methyl-accepting chemotaxis protein